MGVPLDMRVVRTVEEIVKNVIERYPHYTADDVEYRAYKYMDAFYRHYIVRRRKGAQKQAAADRAREQGLPPPPYKVYIPHRSPPPAPRPKIYRKINRGK